METRRRRTTREADSDSEADSIPGATPRTAGDGGDHPAENAQAESTFSSSQSDDSDFNSMMRGLLHELRNPLSSILTAAELVQDTAREDCNISDETAMLLGVVQKESRRLNHILTEFSNFIKLPQPQPAAFDLCAMVRELIVQMQGEKVLSASVLVQDAMPDSSEVFADRSQIRTALRNLLCNAAEAMPQGGTLTIVHRISGPGKVLLCFGDTGSGFSSESQSRAFQPFYSTKIHGIGLGMSAARAIIESARGNVWIEASESAPGEDDGSDDGSEAESSPRVSICVELPSTGMRLQS